jgi:hypothetical protein
MPSLAQTRVHIPTKDILSWTYDEPQFDHDLPVRVLTMIPIFIKLIF